MPKHGTASEMSKEQFREFAGAVLRCLPDDLDTEIAQGWIKNAGSLRRVLREALSPNGKSTTFLRDMAKKGWAPDDGLGVPYLSWRGGGWGLGFRWLGLDWGSRDRLRRLSK